MAKNAHKKLIVLGAGESGIGAALLGKQQGWDVFVSEYGDIKNEYKEELVEEGISFEEGGHSMEKVLEADCVVKSPGISEKTEVMKALRKAEIEICSEIEFAFRYKGDSKIVAITGSNGKSTTTKLTYHVFKEAGYDVAMVGNIGISFAKQIAQNPATWYIVEVSSFQLDDIQRFHPDVAVLLNITPDHLDRYDNKVENYIRSKFRITENQDDKDFFIVNGDDETIEQYLNAQSTKAQKIYYTMNEENMRSVEGALVSNNEMHLRVGD